VTLTFPIPSEEGQHSSSSHVRPRRSTAGCAGISRAGNVDSPDQPRRKEAPPSPPPLPPPPLLPPRHPAGAPQPQPQPRQLLPPAQPLEVAAATVALHLQGGAPDRVQDVGRAKLAHSVLGRHARLYPGAGVDEAMRDGRRLLAQLARAGPLVSQRRRSHSCRSVATQCDSGGEVLRPRRLTVFFGTGGVFFFCCTCACLAAAGLGTVA
jgi:hypothetical protein